MKDRQILMWHLPYCLRIFVGGLCFTLLAAPSFGSGRFTQEETQEKIWTAATKPLTAVPFLPEQALPHDVSVHIFSFLSEQKDLLRVGTVSKSWRKAAEKIWKNRTLDLSYKKLTETDYNALARGIFPQLKLLRGNLNDTGVRILAAVSQRQASTTGELQHDDDKVLQTLPAFTSLNLVQNGIGARGAKVLSSLTTLTSLDLGYNPLGDEGAQALTPLINLTTLYLANNDIRVEGAKALTALTNLTSLYLCNNYIGAEGAKALNALTNLIHLSLSSTYIGDEGVKALTSLITLTSLNLWTTSISDEGARALTTLSNLTILNLGYNRINAEGAIALTTLTNLTSLHLRSTRIEDKGAKALTILTNLTSLNLYANSIGNEGKSALENFKRSRPSLELIY